MTVIADSIQSEGFVFYANEGNKLQELETACIQHEIDHLNGILMVDKEIKMQRNIIKIKRNDPCFCGSGNKYKKCCNK